MLLNRNSLLFKMSLAGFIPLIDLTVLRTLGVHQAEHSFDGVIRGFGGVVGLTLPMARADSGSRPVYYLPCSDLGQVVNLSLYVA